MMQNIDPHSLSNYHQVQTHFLKLTLSVDFDKKYIHGLAEHQLKRTEAAEEFIVDTSKLRIIGVKDQNGNALNFTLNEEVVFLGNALRIRINEETEWVSIEYETRAEAAGIQWMQDGRDEMMYTQSQAILARSWIPCQDTPAVKFTWEAQVENSKKLPMIMSGVPLEKENNNRFIMENPVPSYLMALACGPFEYRDISERCRVYAGKQFIDQAAWEFALMDEMVQKAEALYGTYRWGRFDLLVLPASFPFGGMENPVVTFLTPSLLAGDRSLTNVVAHELAHSWSGNLVSNANWNHFWLNEGFTVYFERRIMEALEGNEYRRLLDVLAWKDLKACVKKLGGQSIDTHLVYQLDERDPDDGMTLIAYEKGSFFLQEIEKITGRVKWDAFLNAYFKKFAFQSIVTEQFLDFLFTSFPEFPELKKLAEEWIYHAGIPASFEEPISSRYNDNQKIAKTFPDLENSQLAGMQEWQTTDWLLFLNTIYPEINQRGIERLDAEFTLSESSNMEILFAWIRLLIKVDATKYKALILRFLSNTGRRKFVEPLFSDLLKQAANYDLALELFGQLKDSYHFITRKSIENLFAKTKK